MGFGHGFNVLLSVLVESMDAGEEFFVCNVFFLQYHAEALALKGAGIQYLVAPACAGGQRNQKVWFFRARSSQIALAPALEITISARANKSRSSSEIYSNWA